MKLYSVEALHIAQPMSFVGDIRCEKLKQKIDLKVLSLEAKSQFVVKLYYLIEVEIGLYQRAYFLKLISTQT